MDGNAQFYDLDRQLDDLTKSCINIPPAIDLQNTFAQIPGTSRPVFESTSAFQWDWRDLPSGASLREKACERAWKRCLNRINKIVESIHAPLASDIAVCVHAAHSGANVLPGLPYPELPVITLSGGTPSLYNSILHRITSFAPSESPALRSHLHPAECTSLLAAMRALVGGFVPSSGPQMRRPAAALAGYDISLLEVWYASLDEKQPLVIFLHDFEQFTPAVVQDVFEICSLHVPKLPLVFILLLSRLSSTAALQNYPRVTRALLHVHPFTAPSGPAVVAKVLSKTFFDPAFEPDVMLGPSVLEYLLQFLQRYGGGVDFLLTVLQLAHMKHFTEPLALLTHQPAMRDEALQSPASRPFLFALYTRLRAHSLVPNTDPNVPFGSPNSQNTSASVSALLAAISAAHITFRRATRRLRHAFAAMMAVQRALAADGGGAGVPGIVNGFKGKEPERPVHEIGARNGMGAKEGLETLDLMCAVLRGRAGREVRYLTAAIGKLSSRKLRIVLQALLALFTGVEDEKHELEAVCTRLEAALTQLPDDVADVPSRTAQLSVGVSEWLVEYLEARLVRLEEYPLWDVWYMGSTPFPAELINPAPRATIISALLHPYAFADAHAELFRTPNSLQGDVLEETITIDGEGATRALWELADTSILFHRCAEAGRMVNVYDWFQAFAVVLEEQRRQLWRMHRRAEDRPRNEKGKDKERAAEMEIDGGGEEDDEGEDDDQGEDEEKWRVEVQARFIRALHELDYMGFVKPTGRKADHIVRTTFDVPD
ncbi:origin recognition complex subunit 3 N-terminus-domain-containing protein [Sparassis latifolia]